MEPLSDSEQSEEDYLPRPSHHQHHQGRNDDDFYFVADQQPYSREEEEEEVEVVSFYGESFKATEEEEEEEATDDEEEGVEVEEYQKNNNFREEEKEEHGGAAADLIPEYDTEEVEDEFDNELSANQNNTNTNTNNEKQYYRGPEEDDDDYMDIPQMNEEEEEEEEDENLSQRVEKIIKSAKKGHSYEQEDDFYSNHNEQQAHSMAAKKFANSIHLSEFGMRDFHPNTTTTTTTTPNASSSPSHQSPSRIPSRRFLSSISSRTDMHSSGITEITTEEVAAEARRLRADMEKELDEEEDEDEEDDEQEDGDSTAHSSGYMRGSKFARSMNMASQILADFHDNADQDTLQEEEEQQQQLEQDYYQNRQHHNGEDVPHQNHTRRSNFANSMGMPSAVLSEFDDDELPPPHHHDTLRISERTSDTLELQRQKLQIEMDRDLDDQQQQLTHHFLPQDDASNLEHSSFSPDHALRSQEEAASATDFMSKGELKRNELDLALKEGDWEAVAKAAASAAEEAGATTDDPDDLRNAPNHSSFVVDDDDDANYLDRIPNDHHHHNPHDDIHNQDHFDNNFDDYDDLPHNTHTQSHHHHHHENISPDYIDDDDDDEKRNDHNNNNNNNNYGNDSGSEPMDDYNQYIEASIQMSRDSRYSGESGDSNHRKRTKTLSESDAIQQTSPYHVEGEEYWEEQNYDDNNHVDEDEEDEDEEDDDTLDGILDSPEANNTPNHNFDDHDDDHDAGHDEEGQYHSHNDDNNINDIKEEESEEDDWGGAPYEDPPAPWPAPSANQNVSPIDPYIHKSSGSIGSSVSSLTIQTTDTSHHHPNNNNNNNKKASSSSVLNNRNHHRLEDAERERRRDIEDAAGLSRSPPNEAREEKEEGVNSADLSPHHHHHRSPTPAVGVLHPKHGLDDVAAPSMAELSVSENPMHNSSSPPVPAQDNEHSPFQGAQNDAGVEVTIDEHNMYQPHDHQNHNNHNASPIPVDGDQSHSQHHHQHHQQQQISPLYSPPREREAEQQQHHLSATSQPSQEQPIKLKRSSGRKSHGRAGKRRQTPQTEWMSSLMKQTRGGGDGSEGIYQQHHYNNGGDAAAGGGSSGGGGGGSSGGGGGGRDEHATATIEDVLREAQANQNKRGRRHGDESADAADPSRGVGSADGGGGGGGTSSPAVSSAGVPATTEERRKERRERRQLMAFGRRRRSKSRGRTKEDENNNNNNNSNNNNNNGRGKNRSRSRNRKKGSLKNLAADEGQNQSMHSSAEELLDQTVVGGKYLSAGGGTTSTTLTGGRSEALEELASNVRETKASLEGGTDGNDSDDIFNSLGLVGSKNAKSNHRKQTQKIEASSQIISPHRKNVRTLVADEDSESELFRAIDGENSEEPINLCRVTINSFNDLITILIRMSDELELSSTFKQKRSSSTAIVDPKALNGVLSHVPSIDVAFSDIRPFLTTMYDEGDRLDGTQSGQCLRGIIALLVMIASTAKKVTVRQEWNAQAETCFVTLLELLRMACVELKTRHEGTVHEKESWTVTPTLQRAWTMSKHREELRALEEGDRTDLRLFQRLSIEVIRQMEEWAPPLADLRMSCRCFGLIRTSQRHSEEEDDNDATLGLGGILLPPIPVSARTILDDVAGEPLPRDDVMERVVLRLMPSTDDLISIAGAEGTQQASAIEDNKSLGTFQSRTGTGTTVVITSILEEPASMVGSRRSSTMSEDYSDGMSRPIGMGGVGKTTVAAMLAARVDVRQHYQGGIAWVNLGNLSSTGFSYETYCDFLRSICDQLSIDENETMGDFPDMIRVPGENAHARSRREVKMMNDARTIVSESLQRMSGSVLIVLDDVWRDEDYDWFCFRTGSSKLCDVVLTTRFRDLLVVSNCETVEIDLLSADESMKLLMAESKQKPDHVLASSAEVRSIVSECANHPLAIRVVGRWLGLKLATAGVINSAEELLEDVTRSLEKISAGGEHNDDGDNLLYEIMSQSLSPAVDGKPTKIIKLCFAAFVLVFCRESACPPVIPLQAADDLFDKVLRIAERDLFEEGSMFETHRRDAMLLIPEALAALGIIKLTREVDSENNPVGSLEVRHEIQREYGEFLCTKYGGLGSLVVEAEVRWNKAFAISYFPDVKDSYEWNEGSPDDARIYALEKLPSHMIRANMFEEAALLLSDQRFVHGRMMLLGMEKGSHRHVKDCVTLCDKIRNLDMTKLNPNEVMSKAFAVVDVVVRPEIESEAKDMSNNGHETLLLEAGRAFHAMGYSLAENGNWDEAILHYETSYKLLESSLGDDELVASILYSLGTVLFEMNEYERSTECFEECLRIRKTNVGDEHIVYAQTLHKIGCVLSAMSDYDAATKKFEKALKIMQTKPNKNRIDIGITLHSIGRVHLTKGDLDDAKKCFEESLRCKKIELGFSHVDLASSYSQLGNIFLDRNDIISAIPLYEEAIRVRKLSKGDIVENDAELAYDEGKLYCVKGERDRGLSSFDKSLEIFKTKLPQKKEAIAKVLNAAACVYVEKCENKKAFRLFEESLQTRRNMLGFVPLEVASTLVNMSKLHENRGKFEKALKCLEEALRIQKLRLGDSEKVACTLEKIGSISKEISQLKKAELAFEETLRILKKVHGPTHINVAKVLHEMGDLMDEINEYDEAISCFTDCLDIRKELLGFDHEDVAETLYSLGFALHNQGHHDRALICFEEAIKVRRTRLGDEHPLVGDTLNIMGFVEAKRGELERSLRLLWDALRIRKLGKDHLKAADTLKNIGNVHREKQDFELAVECYEECLRSRRREVGDEHEKVADALIALGNVQSDMGIHEEAMNCYQEALQIRILAHGDFDDRVASILQNMGIMEFRAGNLEKGRQFLEEFMRIRKMNHTNEAADYVNVLFIIGNIHKIQGSTDDARRAWKEAYEIFNQIGLAEENPQIAEVLNNLLLGRGGDRGRQRKKTVLGRFSMGLSTEKASSVRPKEPMKAIKSKYNRVDSDPFQMD